MSASAKLNERDGLDIYCSVYSGVWFNIKRADVIVRECLSSFPYVWVSVFKGLIWGRCLKMLNAAQLLGGKCQPYSHFSDQLNSQYWCSVLQDVSGCYAFMCFKRADDACFRLFRL